MENCSCFSRLFPTRSFPENLSFDMFFFFYQDPRTLQQICISSSQPTPSSG